MLARLPNLIDPMLLADKNASVEGQLSSSGFDRLADLLFSDVDNIDVKLLFRKNGRLATIEGHISAILPLKCQRCLESVEWPVSSDIKLGVVNSLEQANKLPDGYEPLLLFDENKIPLKNIIEDELLLNLPSVPKHQDNCLVPKILNKKPEPLPKIARASTENSFSILADLKKLEIHNGSTKK